MFKLTGLVLCGLLVGCALDGQGLDVSDTPVRAQGAPRDARVDAEVVLPPEVDAVDADVASAPDVAPAPPDVRAEVPDAAPALPPDVLLAPGAACERSAECASGHCAGRGNRVCTDRACGECEQSTADGQCAPAREGRSCGPVATCTVLDPSGLFFCVSTFDVNGCHSGMCSPPRVINCCAEGRVCDKTGGCRSR